jgi:hypothetical protein
MEFNSVPKRDASVRRFERHLPLDGLGERRPGLINGFLRTSGTWLVYSIFSVSSVSDASMSPERIQSTMARCS